jgi:hypothetical protein
MEPSSVSSRPPIEVSSPLAEAEPGCCSKLGNIIFKVAMIAIAFICFKLNFYVTLGGFLIGIATINPKNPNNVIHRIANIWNHYFGGSCLKQTGGILLTMTFAFYFFPWTLVAGLFGIGAYYGYHLSEEANQGG